MPSNGRSFLSGLITGAVLSLGAAVIVSPEVRKRLKPVVLKGVQKTAAMAENVRVATAKAVEDMEDMIAEAKYEAFKNKEEADVNLGEIIARDPEIQ